MDAMTALQNYMSDPTDEFALIGLFQVVADLQTKVATLEARLNDSDAHAALMQHGLEYMGSEFFTVQPMLETLSAVFVLPEAEAQS